MTEIPVSEKDVWKLTPMEAAGRFGVELETMRERGRILYLLADSSRTEHKFLARWKQWERGHISMPLAVQHALEDPETADRAAELIRGMGGNTSEIALQRLARLAEATAGTSS